MTSLDAAEVAPLRRWLAYVWPAFALGPARELLPSIEGRLATTLPASVDLLRRLPSLSVVTGPNAASGVAGLSAGSAPSGQRRNDPQGIPLPSGGALSVLVLLLVCGALMALLAYTVRRELGPMRRWPL